MNDKKMIVPDQNKALTALNFFLISVMLTCFMFMLRSVMLLIYPDWRVPGLLILTFMIALETLVVHHVLNEAYDISQRRFPTALAELILIVIIAKLITMPFENPASLLNEIGAWQRNFVESFITKDFLFSSFAMLIIWTLAQFFGQSLMQFEENKNLTAQEKPGRVFTDRQIARRRLIGLVFGLGFIMMVFMVILNSQQDLIGSDTNPSRLFLIILLVYFFSGFLFIALNQYSIMKIRWYFNDVPINPNLARRWVLYSLVFILLAILLVIFLPTDFILGLSPLFHAIYEGIIIILSFLEVLFFIPIVYVLSLLNFVETGEPVSEEFQETLPEYTAPLTQQVTGTANWWEILKSVLFWLVFLGVIVFAIWYYLKNRRELRAFFSRIKIGAWLRDFWRWIKEGFIRIKRTAAETFEKGMHEVRTYFQKRKVKLPSVAEILQHLSPRRTVILTYINWVAWSRKQGFNRKGSQTPLEYASIYRRELPEAAEAIDILTRTFVLARYTRQLIEKAEVQDAQSALASIKDAYHAKENAESSVV